MYRACALTDVTHRKGLAMITMKMYCGEAYRDVRGFAEDNGGEKSFNNCFTRLLQIATNYERDENSDIIIVVAKDWAKHSFEWGIFDGKQRLMNGGIIYHGIAQTEDNGSVSLMDRTSVDHRWQIHT